MSNYHIDLYIFYLNCMLFLFNSRLQALQSMMESAHTESLHIKDEKIKTLELHLEEKENLNATLHRQLDTMQKEYQSYLDKYVRLPNMVALCAKAHNLLSSKNTEW